MKIGIFFILVILITLTLTMFFTSGCSKKEKEAENTTYCEKLCNETYVNSTDQLEACWGSCRSFGTKGDAYYKYLDNLTEIRNRETG